MIEKKLGGLNPVRLRIILLSTIALLIILSAVGFWFFKGWLESYATNVREASQKADVSSSDIANLQRLQATLEEEKVAINRTKSIVADSQSYAYQNQIITDIDAYAKSSGVKISGYAFTADTGSGNPSSPTTTEATPGAESTPTPAGLKTTSITVTIENPVRYKSIMKFIHSIEASLTKMQLTGVSLSQDASSGGDFVAIEPLTVEVYIK
jgi:hypothetical protein